MRIEDLESRWHELSEEVIRRMKERRVQSPNRVSCKKKPGFFENPGFDWP